MNSWNYPQWNAYFERNSQHRLKIDLSQEPKLTKAEKALIFPSIRAFQKGEGSDGRHLLETVEHFAKEIQEPAYASAMQWFVREENWHSAYLRQYMDFYSVRPLKRTLLDSIFRRLRKTGGLKGEIMVLVTAEMIALCYYDALSRAVDSPALRSICAQMLHDETRHIRFQSYTLSRLGLCWPHFLLRILLMEASSVFVWLAFRKVFRAGGYSFIRFLRKNMDCLRQSMNSHKG